LLLLRARSRVLWWGGGDGGTCARRLAPLGSSRHSTENRCSSRAAGARASVRGTRSSSRCVQRPCTQKVVLEWSLIRSRSSRATARNYVLAPSLSWTMYAYRTQISGCFSNDHPLLNHVLHFHPIPLLHTTHPRATRVRRAAVISSSMWTCSTSSATALKRASSGASARATSSTWAWRLSSRFVLATLMLL